MKEICAIIIEQYGTCSVLWGWDGVFIPIVHNPKRDHADIDLSRFATQRLLTLNYN